MLNFKSISFGMTELQGAGRILPPHVCDIQMTPCGILLTYNKTSTIQSFKEKKTI